MKHIIQKVLKRIWHDVVIILGFTILRPLAMTCKQTALITDTSRAEAVGFARLKYRLHLSICEGCIRYLKLTEYLEAQYRQPALILSESEIAQFNQQLIRKFKS